MGLQNILESQLGQVEQDVKQQLWQLMQLVALHNQLNQKLSSLGLNQWQEMEGRCYFIETRFHVLSCRNNASIPSFPRCVFLSSSWNSVGMAWVRKRIFMQKDVESALAKEPELLPTWTRLVQKGDVPFVKILADGEDAEYQFRPRCRPSDSKTLRLFQ